MRFLSLVLRTIMPNIKHTADTGMVFAPINKKKSNPHNPIAPQAEQASTVRDGRYTERFLHRTLSFGRVSAVLNLYVGEPFVQLMSIVIQLSRERENLTSADRCNL